MIQLFQSKFYFFAGRCFISLVGSAILFLFGEIATAGMGPANLTCTREGFSFDGIVPADSISVLAKVKYAEKNIVLISGGELGTEEAREFKELPQVFLELAKSKLPYDGLYVLNLKKGKSKETRFTIASTSKILKMSSSLVSYTFNAKIEFNLRELNQKGKVTLKDVKCKWSYEDP